MALIGLYWTSLDYVIGGGGGNRTRVRKPSAQNVYMCSRSIEFRVRSRPAARLRTVASPVWFRPSPLEPKSQASLLYAILITRTDIE